ncbi:hypothetical protein V3C99_000420 [Haemonchus contortus]|uniref:BCAS3 domain-containing protein n=1 Tax=Haemonchus contortus TaxID=6289 RepID=A0A7I4Z5R3_HAECO
MFANQGSIVCSASGLHNELKGGVHNNFEVLQGIPKLWAPIHNIVFDASQKRMTKVFICTSALITCYNIHSKHVSKHPCEHGYGPKVCNRTPRTLRAIILHLFQAVFEFCFLSY